MKLLFFPALIAASAAAQGLTEPPPILQLVRKPGTTGASIKPYASAGAAVQVIGMRSVTGLPETWMMEAHYSFASVEDLDQRLAALAPVKVMNDPADPLSKDTLAPARTILALYRDEWSYRAPEAIRAFPRARYFQISIFRVRPGAESSFGDLVRLRRASADAVNLDRPELAYQVISGAPSGTFVFVAPIASLRSMDNGVAPAPVVAEGLVAARAKDGARLASETEMSREHLLFRVEPRISYVSDEFAASDRMFWR
jgi:hypothetical protein